MFLESIEYTGRTTFFFLSFGSKRKLISGSYALMNFQYLLQLPVYPNHLESILVINTSQKSIHIFSFETFSALSFTQYLQLKSFLTCDENV